MHSFAFVDAHALHFFACLRVSMVHINILVIRMQLRVGGMCEQEQLYV